MKKLISIGLDGYQRHEYFGDKFPEVGECVEFTFCINGQQRTGYAINSGGYVGGDLIFDVYDLPVEYYKPECALYNCVRVRGSKNEF